MNPNQRRAKAAYRPVGRFIPNPKLMLRKQLAGVCRFKHFSRRTEGAYWYWTKRYRATLHTALERGCVEDQPQPLRNKWRMK